MNTTPPPNATTNPLRPTPTPAAHSDVDDAVALAIALSYILFLCCCGYCCMKSGRNTLRWCFFGRWPGCVCGCRRCRLSRRDASVAVVIYSSLVFGPFTGSNVEKILQKRGGVAPLPPAALDPYETVIAIRLSIDI